MAFDPSQYLANQAQIVSISLGADGDTVTVESTAFDPNTGAALANVSDMLSLSFINGQISAFQSFINNASAFVAAVQPSVQVAQSSGLAQNIPLQTNQSQSASKVN
jgi:hypothetical protein